MTTGNTKIISPWESLEGCAAQTAALQPAPWYQPTTLRMFSAGTHRHPQPSSSAQSAIRRQWHPVAAHTRPQPPTPTSGAKQHPCPITHTWALVQTQPPNGTVSYWPSSLKCLKNDSPLTSVLRRVLALKHRFLGAGTDLAGWAGLHK